MRQEIIDIGLSLVMLLITALFAQVRRWIKDRELSDDLERLSDAAFRAVGAVAQMAAADLRDADGKLGADTRRELKNQASALALSFLSKDQVARLTQHLGGSERLGEVLGTLIESAVYALKG